MMTSPGGRGGGAAVTPYDGLYGEDPPQRGTFFRQEVYEKVTGKYAIYVL